MEAYNDFTKEVYFEQYCKTCHYKNTSESDEPCFECLCEPVRQNSHKPVRWIKKGDAK